MKSTRVSFRRSPVVLGIALALGCNLSEAVSVGEMQGGAFVGRPLNLTALMTLSEGESAEALCLAAEVMYGDSKIDDARVKLSLGRVESGSVLVRMRVDKVLDEPVVTVVLRAGCKAATSRRTVVLAELPPPAVEPQPGLPQGQGGASVFGAGLVGVPQRTGAVVPLVPPVLKPVVGKALLPPKQNTEVSNAGRHPAPVAKTNASDRMKTVGIKPRLKLDVADLMLPVTPELTLSLDVHVLAEASTETRQQARALWAAINKTPDEVLKEAVSTQINRDKEVAAADAALKQAKATEEGLRAAVEEAKEQKFNNPLVWILVAVALVATTVAAGLGMRTRRSAASGKDWWRAGVGGQQSGAPNDSMLDDASFVSEHGDLRSDVSNGMHRFRSEKAAASPVDIDREAEAAQSPPLDLPSFFASSYLPNARQVKTEELFDVQQQADFFVSLGEHQQAIDLLETHIRDNPEGSPLAYLDLLQIHHVLKRETEFESIRRRFQAQFAVRIPDFADFAESSDGLDAFPAAISRISALWPDAKVIEVLEEAVFREPNSAFDDRNFTLEAYRDLLLLYGIAKQVCASAADPSGWWSSSQEQKSAGSPASSRQADSFIKTKMEPLVAPQMMQAGTTVRLNASRLPGDGLDTGDVDFDLDSLSPSDISVEPAHASLDDDLASLRNVLSTSLKPIQTPSADEAPTFLDPGLTFELGASDAPVIGGQPKSFVSSLSEDQGNLIDFDISVAPEANMDLNFAYVEKSSHPPLGPTERKSSLRGKNS